MSQKTPRKTPNTTTSTVFAQPVRIRLDSEFFHIESFCFFFKTKTIARKSNCYFNLLTNLLSFFLLVHPYPFSSFFSYM